MSNLNRDVLYLILEELKDDKNTLYSCLSVNKSWCIIIIPILWKDPWKFLKQKKKLLFLNVIISHLSNESRNNLIENVDIFTNSYQKPLFNYISFCKHLNFNVLMDIIHCTYFNYDDKISIVKNDIINLFINENTKFTHLYIPNNFDYQIHLIPGVEYCFSELQFLRCDFNINQNTLEGLAKIIESIKKLEFKPENNTGIIKLIEAQKNLNNIHLSYNRDDSFCKPVEESLFKHVDTIQYLKINWVPTTKEFLTYHVNLISLEITSIKNANWNHLENVSLPRLKILKVKEIPSNDLANLINNTKGHLTEINIGSSFPKGIDNKRLIQTICQKCPKLKYLMLLFKNKDISDIENLLIKCQYLNGLIIDVNRYEMEFDWNKLFNILIKSSPPSLFKFKFFVHRFRTSKLESLKFFFDNWKGRHPILLQIAPNYVRLESYIGKYIDIIEKYKAEGIIKKYDNDLNGNTFEEFEWIKEKKKI